MEGWRQISKGDWKEGTIEVGRKLEKWITWVAKWRECLWKGEWLELRLLVPTHFPSVLISKETTKIRTFRRSTSLLTCQRLQKYYESVVKIIPINWKLLNEMDKF